MRYFYDTFYIIRGAFRSPTQHQQLMQLNRTKSRLDFEFAIYLESRWSKGIKYHILTSQLVDFLLVDPLRPDQTSTSILPTEFLSLPSCRRVPMSLFTLICFRRCAPAYRLQYKKPSNDIHDLDHLSSGNQTLRNQKTLAAQIDRKIPLQRAHSKVDSWNLNYRPRSWQSFIMSQRCIFDSSIL